MVADIVTLLTPVMTTLGPIRNFKSVIPPLLADYDIIHFQQEIWNAPTMLRQKRKESNIQNIIGVIISWFVHYCQC